MTEGGRGKEMVEVEEEEGKQTVQRGKTRVGRREEKR